ncbi:hypothetical protein [Mycobacterium uberis]|uniref:hypothetical protein n=1 Tax=Mycobacterium uberis TaxID=2162698 RepID=UPI000E3035E5|nr:hypothetical protein [Mycobacterium uberis]
MTITFELVVVSRSAHEDNRFGVHQILLEVKLQTPVRNHRLVDDIDLFYVVDQACSEHAGATTDAKDAFTSLG